MSDVLVSVRIPRSLSDALRHAAEEDHYMDTSELIRSISREQWERAKDPLGFELGKLRTDIKEELTTRIEKRAKERVLKELKDIQKEVRHD